MTTFRYKPDKIKYLTSINTLDTMHRKHVSEFESRRKEISDLKSEKSLIGLQLSQIEKPELKSDFNTINDIKKRSQLKTRLQKINQELFDIENNVSELEYYSQTNDILLDYYNEVIPIQPTNNSENVEYSPSNDNLIKTDLSEDNLGRDDSNDMGNHFIVVHDNENVIETLTNGKSKLEELNLLSQKRRKPKKITRRRVRKTDIVNTKSILDFFNDKSEKQESSEENEDESSAKEPPQPPIEQVVSNKATLFDDYMTIIDKTYVRKEKKNMIRTCTKCDVEKTLIQSEGFYVCQKCGEVEHTIIESEIPSHKDSITEKSRYPYKRLNHLVEFFIHKIDLKMVLSNLI